MSSSFKNSLWLIGALMVQTAFAPLLTVHGVLPSFVTIVVVLAALRGGARRGGALGVAGGLLTDVVSGTGGGWTLAYLTVAMVAGALRARFFADGIVAPSVMVGLAVLVRNAVFWTVTTAEGYPRGYGVAHLHAAIEQAAVTAAVAVVVQLLRARFADPSARIARFA